MCPAIAKVTSTSAVHASEDAPLATDRDTTPPKDVDDESNKYIHTNKDEKVTLSLSLMPWTGQYAVRKPMSLLG